MSRVGFCLAGNCWFLPCVLCGVHPLMFRIFVSLQVNSGRPAHQSETGKKVGHALLDHAANSPPAVIRLELRNDTKIREILTNIYYKYIYK